MKRLLTAAVGAPLALAITFLLPQTMFFVIVVCIFEWAAFEMVLVARESSPRLVRTALLVAIPPVAAGLTIAGSPSIAPDVASSHLWGLLLALPVVTATLLVLSRAKVEQALPSAGLFAFGLPYIAVPVAGLTLLQGRDPWLLFLLYAIVWLGDAAAFYAGSKWGRRRLAPTLSPKKSWEGALANLALAPVIASLWSLWRLGHWQASLAVLAILTSMAAQIGDLLESMIKRAAGVKDSGNVLPGHGGMWDRMDAMLMAVPVFLAGLWLLGFDAISR